MKGVAIMKENSVKTTDKQAKQNKMLRRNWEIAACAFLFGVAMIIIGVFL